MTTTKSDKAIRELDRRTSDGIDVRLLSYVYSNCRRAPRSLVI